MSESDLLEPVRAAPSPITSAPLFDDTSDQRHPGERALTWLRVEPVSAGRFEPRGRRRAATRAGGDLQGGISRWRRALSRRRALVALRRYLLLGASAALLTAIAIALAGGDLRTWWLLAPLAVALAGAAIAMSRRVTVAQTAAMFDDGLALRNRVATALELSERKTGDSRGGAGARARAELAARVTGEASAAVAESVGTVRLRAVRAPLESATLTAVALALGLLLVLAPVPTVAGATRSAAGRQSQGAETHSPGQTRRARPGAHAGPPRSATSPPPLALTPKHQNGRLSSQVPQTAARQLRREGLASARHPGRRDVEVVQSHLPGGTAGQSGLAGKHGGSGATKSLPSPPASAGGELGSPTRASQGATTPTAGASPDGGANRPGPAGGGRRGLSKAAKSGPANASERGGSGHSGSGGGEAGSAAGNSALGPGLAPDLPHGSAGLPLQAGYAPSLGRRPPRGDGTSQTPNGSGHGGHTAQSYSTSGSGGTGFAVLPPSSDAAPAANRTQRDNYFGVANQLPLKSW